MSLPRDQGPNLPDDVFDTADIKPQATKSIQPQLGTNQVSEGDQSYLLPI